MVWLRFEEAFWRTGSPAGRGPMTATLAAAPDVLTVVGEPPRSRAWIDVGRRDRRPDAPRGHRGDAGDSTGSRSTIQEFQAAVLADLAPYATAPG